MCQLCIGILGRAECRQQFGPDAHPVPSLDQSFPSRHITAIPTALPLPGSVEDLPFLAISGQPGRCEIEIAEKS